MQNIFIVPGMQHGRHAKPLLLQTRNLPGLQVLHGQNYVPKLFTPYCKLLCYCFKYTIKTNHF